MCISICKDVAVGHKTEKGALGGDGLLREEESVENENVLI